MRELAAWLVHEWHRRHRYPGNDGRPIRRDPTYGKISRRVQWLVNDNMPGLTTAERVIHEQHWQAVAEQTDWLR